MEETFRGAGKGNTEASHNVLGSNPNTGSSMGEHERAISLAVGFYVFAVLLGRH